MRTLRIPNHAFEAAVRSCCRLQINLWNDGQEQRQQYRTEWSLSSEADWCRYRTECRQAKTGMQRRAARRHRRKWLAKQQKKRLMRCQRR